MNAVQMHCRGYTLKQGVPHPQSKGKEIQMVFITEADVYRLITKSRLQSAVDFERFVFEEILPSIRTYGAFFTKETLKEFLQNPETLTYFLQQMYQLSKEKETLQIQLSEAEEKVAYFDAMMEGNHATNFRTTAKQLGIKPLYFIAYLLEHQYLYRNKRNDLLPYQHHLEEGLFQLVEFRSIHGHYGLQTLVTPKGKKHFFHRCEAGDFIHGGYETELR